MELYILFRYRIHTDHLTLVGYTGSIYSFNGHFLKEMFSNTVDYNLTCVVYSYCSSIQYIDEYLYFKEIRTLCEPFLKYNIESGKS